MKRLRFLVMALLLLSFLLGGQGWGLEYGEAAPDFKLADMDGKIHSLADYRGKAVVLKLATTWCPTCKQQTEELASIVEFLDENQIVLIDVFLQDTEAMIEEFLAGQKHPRAFIPLLDDGQVRKTYGVYLIPRLLIIDREQRVRRDGSLATAGDLKSFLSRALKPIEGS